MDNTFLIRLSAIAATLSLVAVASTAAAGRLRRPLGAGDQPLSAGVHVLDLVSREQAGTGSTHLPRIAITLPSGWFNYNGWAMNNGGRLGVAFWDVNKVYPTPCRWQGKPMIDPGRTVDGLARCWRHGRSAMPASPGVPTRRGPWQVPQVVSAERHQLRDAAIRATSRAGRRGAGRPTAGSKARARSTASGSSTSKGSGS